LRYATNFVNGQGEYYGIDISANIVEKAKTNFLGHDNIHFYKANAEQIPFENDFFDLIICINSFHHYYSPI
jgi:ubiquinone/menaquinone biosynthesis C-methylase UbiE